MGMKRIFWDMGLEGDVGLMLLGFEYNSFYFFNYYDLHGKLEWSILNDDDPDIYILPYLVDNTAVLTVNLNVSTSQSKQDLLSNYPPIHYVFVNHS